MSCDRATTAYEGKSRHVSTAKEVVVAEFGFGFSHIASHCRGCDARTYRPVDIDIARYCGGGATLRAPTSVE
jgi:hypothetical protein